jgi:hypothetical protein
LGVGRRYRDNRNLYLTAFYYRRKVFKVKNRNAADFFSDLSLVGVKKRRYTEVRTSETILVRHVRFICIQFRAGFVSTDNI